MQTTPHTGSHHRHHYQAPIELSTSNSDSLLDCQTDLPTIQNRTTPLSYEKHEVQSLQNGIQSPPYHFSLRSHHSALYLTL